MFLSCITICLAPPQMSIKECFKACVKIFLHTWQMLTNAENKQNNSKDKARDMYLASCLIQYDKTVVKQS